ncbi:aminotransferase [Erythrobacter sp. CCH5-A1]|jgi:aspartate/methionine/tyrosine aminotransferase|uniref:aminotransferase n=1 Tax=Erythrobacter sp. CCH5-A1 TaxID=1768792 RepID=UPI000832E4C6|nr:aminotransferase [Erythrobacter sp. CCH5-A1]
MAVIEGLAAPATTIFERMSRAAAEAGAINLGQGFPDLADPPELIEAARRALSDKSNQYPPMRGLPALRQAIAGFYAREQGLALDEREVLVTSGATEALAAAILSLVRPGDEVVLVQPLYDAYLPLVERAGGIARFVNLTPPGWTLPLDALAAAINDRTRLLILNTPNNPAGSTIDRATLEAVGALAERHNVILLCDEVWEAMLFEGAAHVSPLAVPALRERTVKIGSAGKIFSLTGWKVGWACAAPQLVDTLSASHQFLTFTTPPALQWAVAEGLELPAAWHAAHRARYDGGRARLIAGLEQAGYVVLPNAATWFVTVDLAASGIAISDMAFCKRSIPEAGVAAIPISSFYAQDPLTGYVRLCFAKGNDTLDAAVERLARFRKSLM